MLRWVHYNTINQRTNHRAPPIRKKRIPIFANVLHSHQRTQSTVPGLSRKVFARGVDLRLDTRAALQPFRTRDEAIVVIHSELRQLRFERAQIDGRGLDRHRSLRCLRDGVR